jgi:hypothetical protein
MASTNREILSTISEILVSNSKGDIPHYVALDEIRKLLNFKVKDNYTEMQDKINKTRDYLDILKNTIIMCKWHGKLFRINVLI